MSTGTGRGTPHWHLIVLNWNGRDDTLRCLASLSQITREVSVTCVDNGSSDGSQEAIRARFPDVTLLEAGRNLGYAGGNNLGLRHALESGADWAALVNNDATVAPDAIDGFEQAIAARPRAGLLAGKVFFDDRPDTIWFAGQRVNAVLGYSGRPRGYGRRDGPAYRRVTSVDRPVGALMAISRVALEEVGPLDETLFAYVEDVDLAFRVKRAGFEVIFAPGARAWHRVSSSTGGEKASTHTLYYGARNTIVVLQRHRPLGRFGDAIRRLVIRATFSLYALTRSRRKAALAAVRAGYRDAMAGRLGPAPNQLPKRAGGSSARR